MPHPATRVILGSTSSIVRAVSNSSPPLALHPPRLSLFLLIGWTTYDLFTEKPTTHHGVLFYLWDSAELCI
jgi:hypothetical protein